jgi:nicotinamide-nucleotide amidase
MKCEILSIGSELTSGQNLDTNSQWLSRRLAEIGVAVGWHTTIADDVDSNIEAFQIATRRAGLVLATGGLGPTQDDLTREVLARVAGVELVLDPESLALIEAMFQKRNRTMPDRNRVQAMFPAGAEVIPNHNGTAPGIWMHIGSCLVGAMPGIPSEMFAMFEDQLRPRILAAGLGGGVLIQRKINAFGAGESAIEQRLLDLTRRDHVPEVGITVADASISLRILARAASRAEAETIIAPVEATIRERLGDFVFGVDDEDLQSAVAKLLIEKRLTIGTAESITGGLLADQLVTVPGASRWFRGGIVSYSNEVKRDVLGVPQQLLDAKGAVSPEVVEAMAIGCRQLLKTDLAVSTVGVAGPGDLGPDLPEGLVYVAVASTAGAQSSSFNWSGTRQEIRRRTAKFALNRVRLHLLRAASPL